METVKQQPSSVFPGGDFEPIKANYETINTTFLIVFLCIVFWLLKTFIYIPDEKRKGK